MEITTLEQLQQYVGKPLHFSYVVNGKNVMDFIMVLKKVEPLAHPFEDNQIKYQHCYGTHLFEMFNIGGEREIMLPYYNQELERLSLVSAQNSISTLTEEEMKHYKRAVHRVIKQGWRNSQHVVNFDSKLDF